MTNEANNKNENERDDLTLISGIGQTRQQWLQEKLHVYSFRDLATLSADEILNKMKAEGQIISRSRIEAWVKQAQQFVDNAGEKLPLTAREDGWKPFASFVVEFQTHQTVGGSIEQRTRVHHMEADHTKMWTGVEHKELCAWMLQQLGIEAEPIPAATNLTEPKLDQTQPELPPLAMEHLQQFLATMQQAAATSRPDLSAIAQPPPGVSKRYERLLAKVQQETAAGPQPNRSIPAQPPPGVSKRYERLLAKVQQETAPTSHPVSIAMPELPEGGERYQRLLARVQEQERSTRQAP